MIVEFMRAVREKLAADLANNVESTGKGAATSWDDYRYRVGIATGLQRARNAIDDVYKQFMKGDEE